MEHLHYCKNCKKYTLEQSCSICKRETTLPRPPKYSPEDKYGEYRRQIKREILKEENLY